MPAGNGSALALAARLRALDDDALTALLVARDVHDRRIRDHFDLAESLLDRASVQHALSRLDRPTLAVLATLAQRGPLTLDELQQLVPDADAGAAVAVGSELALLDASDPDGPLLSYDGVAEQFAAWPALGLPSLAHLVNDPPPPALEPVSDADARFLDRTAGERAFATVTAVTEFVAELAKQPARELAKGGIALPDSKRLALISGVELDELPPLREIAERAGLVLRDSHLWKAGDESDAWRLLGADARWGQLADSWLRQLPREIRDVLAQRTGAVWGEGLKHYLDWFYPAGGDWMRARSAEVLHDAELLGLSAQGSSTTAGTALLERGTDAAVAVIAEQFPDEVDKVYIQNDLTVVAPGPLEPAADAHLRVMADLETRGLAATYRFTPASLTRALASGESAAGIREFLGRLSLTGMPQPLEYLIDETAERYGALRVGALPQPRGSARSYVRAESRTLLDPIAVDTNLGALGLRRDGDQRLISPVDPEAVFWALTDARYPAAMEDASGTLVRVDRTRARAVDAPQAQADTVPLLVERLRLGGEAEPEETGAAWLARQLEIAIRGKSTVRVTVQLPDGSTPTYSLEPAALAGGRLRARDRASDIERTLPLSSITAVEPL